MENNANSLFVSIVIPVYNGEKFLQEALASVFSQTYRDFEVIVIDDGSTDRSPEIIRSYPSIRYFLQENRGVAAARMRGIELAKGELIAFLDQDDVWPSEKLAQQVNEFIDPACQCVIGKTHYFTVGDVPKNFKRERLEKDELSYLPGVVLARKTLFHRFPFSVRYTNGSDSDWFFRLHEAHIPIVKLDTVLLHVRIHEENNSHREMIQYGELLSILKGSIERKRKNTPLISVVIPVHNGEKFIWEAIESIFNQTYTNVEVIVIDDGSTDETKQALSHYSIRYFYQEQRGIGSARNRGMEHAKGEYIAFLDADDVWMPGKLEKQLAQFAHDPKLAFLFGKVHHFFSDGESAQKYRPPPEALLGFCAGTLMVRKKSVDTLGFFSTEYKVGEFIEWCLRAKKLGMKMGVLPDVLLKRRIHGENSTLKYRGDFRDYLRVIQQYKGVSFELQPISDKM